MFIQKLKEYNVILASQSPRRLELMKKLDIPFTVELKEVEEEYDKTLIREEITNYLSILKAKPFLNTLGDKDLLITADTIVWHLDKALGKPKDNEAAKEMLRGFSNKSHEVISSICLTTKKRQHVFHDVTQVSFKKVSEKEINYYVDNYKPFDKAGAYGIQEWIGLIAVNKIVGSYFNVMGFPVDKLHQELLNMPL